MSLKTTIAGVTSALFDNLGDLILTGTYVRVSGVSYDPASRRVSASEDRTSVRVALARNEVDDTNDDQKAAVELQALIPAADLPFTPKGSDFVELDGVTYGVTEIKTDPAGAVHKLTLVL